MPLAEGPVIDPEHTRSRPCGHVGAAQHAEQGGPTDWGAELGRQLRTGRAAEGERDHLQRRALAQGAAPICGDQLREPLGEDHSRAAPGTTAEAADLEAEDQLPTGEWQVSHGAAIDALDTLGPPRTERTAGEACRCSKVQRDRLAVEGDLLKAETSQVRKERR